MFTRQLSQMQPETAEEQYRKVMQPLAHYSKDKVDLPGFNELGEVAKSKRYLLPDSKISLLHWVCGAEDDSLALVKHMVELGFNPADWTFTNATPIHYALDKGNIKIAVFLATVLKDNKESLDLKHLFMSEPMSTRCNLKNLSPVYHAVSWHNLPLLRIIVEATDMSILQYATIKGETLLCPAVKAANDPLINYLLEHNTPIEYRWNRFQSHSALAETVLLKDTTVAERLLDAGANPDFQVAGRTPILALAIERLNVPLVDLLLTKSKIGLSHSFRNCKAGWLCQDKYYDEKVTYVDWLCSLIRQIDLRFSSPDMTILPTGSEEKGQSLSKIVELMCQHLHLTQNDLNSLTSALRFSPYKDAVMSIIDQYTEASTHRP